MQANPQTRESGLIQISHPHRRSVVLIALVVSAVAAVETARLTGVRLPAPFIVIYGTVALAGAFCGLRIGLTSAGFVSAYVIYCALIGYGPATLTGGVPQVAIAIALAIVIGGSLGHEHDVRRKLMQELAARESELRAVGTQLQQNIVETKTHLENTRTELGHTRYQMEQAMTHAPISVVAIDLERRINFVNTAALEQFGCEKLPDFITDWDTLARELRVMDPDGNRIPLADGPVARALRLGEITRDFASQISSFNGETRWCSGYVAPIRDSDENIIGATIMFLDTTDQRDAALALQRLTRMLFKVQEDERGKLAHELHDQLGQSLTAIKLSLHAVANASNKDEAVAVSMEQIDALTEVTRKMSLDLRPTALDDFGLQTALEAHLNQVQKPQGVSCQLVVNGELANISDETTTVAYRIIQEAVDNALAHSDARLIEVRLSNKSSMLRIEVIDDGCGFDKAEIEKYSVGAKLVGLSFMHERARQNGGELSISTSEGNGTWLSADLPLTIRAESA